MTIQEIVSHRVAEITFQILCCPASQSQHHTNLEFLNWLESKFGNEYRHARWSMFHGDLPSWQHILPTREKAMRKNRYRWNYPGVK